MPPVREGIDIPQSAGEQATELAERGRALVQSGSALKIVW